MAAMVSTLLFAFLSLLSVTRAQDRAPHGLNHEHPVALPPSAFDFFHPSNQQAGNKNPCAESSCSPLPLAATVESSLAHASRSKPERGGSRVGAGGIAVIIFGFVFAVLLAMGVYYVVITRRANTSRSNSIQPDA
ncbi:hypothetical protein RJ640_006063 [Escallonia rubra]|uniref:Transmembrane protein n=1 Tax=Escallonia rubra TaxID=112253 RepID=A0AA88UHV0_9ASTE|nr:hypothetical protein RJ640_006063 [Escallonia rubra]